MRWDLFGRVVDNWGDAGVCWRLAADLASRGERVRLWLDDPAPLAWMAPDGSPGVELRRWDDDASLAEPHEVVVEAFGCDPPPAFVGRMAAMAPAPVWINLEYLSAEAYVEASHGLPSPQLAGPGRGLCKWFFFPGFTERSGGVLREPGLVEARQAFARDAWLAGHGLGREAGERVVTLFCYDNPRLDALLDALAAAPTLLLAAAEAAARQVQALLGAGARRGRLRARLPPPMAQPQFDRLLWSADLNVVRGEDSFVRAMWAGAPFIWHIYPQADGVHARKLDAFADRLLDGAAPDAARAMRTLLRRWNGLEPGPLELPDADAWRSLAQRWRHRLLGQEDLTTRLQRFVTAKR